MGLEATAKELLTYDKGIDPATGKGIWGGVTGCLSLYKNSRYEFGVRWLLEETRYIASLQLLVVGWWLQIADKLIR